MRRRALALGMLLALASCRGKEPAAATAQPVPVSVGSENVARVILTTVVSGPAVAGTLQPENAAVVRAQLQGQVADITVREGQPVERGQLIARIEDPSARGQVASAEAAVQTAASAVDLARRNEARSRTLEAEGAISKQELETVEQQRVNAEAALAQAKAQLAAASQEQGRTLARAPFSGVLGARQVNPGDVVQPGTPLFTVVDPSKMIFEATVPASALAELRVGSRTDFEVLGYPQPFQGVVDRISPAVDPATGQVKIFVSVPNQSGALVAGLHAEGRVAESAVQAPAVPADAIDESSTRPQLATVQDGKVVRLEVKPGIVDSMTELVAVPGIEPGLTVLRGGARSLGQGTPVQLGNPGAR